MNSQTKQPANAPAQLSPQNISFANQFSAGMAPSHQTVNISQYKQQAMMHGHQKVNLSLERPLTHTNDLSKHT